jgi:hypothetical protein
VIPNRIRRPSNNKTSSTNRITFSQPPTNSNIHSTSNSSATTSVKHFSNKTKQVCLLLCKSLAYVHFSPRLAAAMVRVTKATAKAQPILRRLTRVIHTKPTSKIITAKVVIGVRKKKNRKPRKVCFPTRDPRHHKFASQRTKFLPDGQPTFMAMRITQLLTDPAPRTRERRDLWQSLLDDNPTVNATAAATNTSQRKNEVA